ncbi:hypothetical protein [Micromonospora phaseoli]|nr:hypothetical protein [Micromonospora phaseoli]
MLESLPLLLAFWGVGLAVLYLVIRLAVRHAIEDADRRRSGGR